MPALAGEVERIPLGRERHAQFLEPRDCRRRLRHDELDRRAIVEPGAGDHRVLDMALEGIAFLEYRGDPALGPGGRPLVHRALGEHGDLKAIGEIERGGEAGGAGADDEDVGGLGFGHARLSHTVAPAEAGAALLDARCWRLAQTPAAPASAGATLCGVVRPGQIEEHVL